jgi:hypothetical protein
MPLPMLYRQALQYAGCVDEVGQRLTRNRRTIGNNLLVASAAERDARVYELDSRRLATRGPMAGTIATTNHFQTPLLAGDQKGLMTVSSEPRLARVEEMLRDRPVDVSRAMGILSDDRCLSPTECLWSRLLNAGTIYSTVFEPADGRIWVRAGDHDRRRFEALSVPGATSMQAPVGRPEPVGAAV